MTGNFAAGLSPQAFLLVAFAALLGSVYIGNRLGRLLGPAPGDAATAALGTGLAAVFGIVALVLSFSFSFALNRYEERWHLVVQEANDIGTAYLRASILEPGKGEKLRGLLREYTADRIDYYKNDADPAAQTRDQSAGDALQDRMWGIASEAVRANPQSLGASLLMQVTNDVIDISSEQRAVLHFRLRGSALFLIFAVAVLGAVSIGLAFGYTNFNSWFVACLFGLLLALLVYTIIDLDSPQSGFVQVNLTPLYEQQQSMVPHP